LILESTDGSLEIAAKSVRYLILNGMDNFKKKKLVLQNMYINKMGAFRRG
jgi:hypothetical protein